MERSGYGFVPLGANGPNYIIHHPNNNTSEGGTIGYGTNTKFSPKAPPAQCLLDLLPKPLGKNPTLLPRRTEEICVLGLINDYRKTASTSTAATPTAALSVISTSSSSKGGGSSSVAATLEEWMDEILVPIEDWMEAPEGLKVCGFEVCHWPSLIFEKRQELS